MRAIVKEITAARLPVVGYVAPSGARAASAGTYILYACHVAAMAPGTNLGAATPVQLGGLPGVDRDEEPAQEEEAEQPASTGDAKKDKLINDATAYLRSLAQMRGRNVEWAERAVREAASLPAAEALEQGVIDLVARDLEDLKRQLHGRPVNLLGAERLLDTLALSFEPIEPDWHSRLLSIISNPNVAYILMLIGIYGLIYEFANPGAIVPGTAGAVSLVLALYAFHVLPINYAGVALILLGVALMVAEAVVPSFGALGIGGVIAFVIGSLILVDTDAPGFGISVPLILAFSVTTSLVLFAVIGMAVRSRQRPVVSGAEQLIGARGLALAGFDRSGPVRVHGELWTARTDVPLREGQAVRVIGRDGLVLKVTAVDDEGVD
jgi:membrane-bound serine protease (ClpP class)